MSRRRKNAGEGYGFMFSGAYSEKKDAVAKEKTRKGSFIKGMPTRHGYRYVVMTPRDNPRKRRRNSIASNILEQLGGRKFSSMTGAKNFVSDKNSLRFKLPANFARRGINLVRITLDPSDTYTLEFMKMRGTHVETISTRDGVYADSLQSVFASETGLETSLGSMGRNSVAWGGNKYPREVLDTGDGYRVQEIYPSRFKVFTDTGQSQTLTSKKKALQWIAGDRARRGNPMDLIVMGANPHKTDRLTEADRREISSLWHTAQIAGYHSFGDRVRYVQREFERAHPGLGSIAYSYASSEFRGYGMNPGAEISVEPGQTITLRVNPQAPLVQGSGDANYMEKAAQELYGKTLAQLTGGELSKVAMLAASMKVAALRGNGLFTGWAPGRKFTARERAAHRREHKQRVRAVASEMKDEYKRMRRSARSSFRGKKKLEALFHEVYGENPAERCGARIGRYVCSRKPGHSGPHLPQGATLRPRSRHNWGPRGNPSAESIREEFTGAEVDRISTYREAGMPAGDYALLGKLLALYVKPLAGGQVQVIKATGGTQVVSDESARQIYFVGGDQDISSALAVFGAIDRGAGVFELGEARRIDYKQRKEHVPDPDVDEWRHEFGEESGVRPKVLFDANHKRLLLEGGEYEIRPEGIVN